MDPRHNLGDRCSNCMFLTCLVISFKGIVLNIIPNKTLIYFIEITNKISSFKTSFKKNGFSCKKVWKIKLLSHWDHAWVFWWGTCKENFLAKTSLIWLDETIIHSTFFTQSEFIGLGKSSPSILVNNRAPPENVFFTTYDPS